MANEQWILLLLVPVAVLLIAGVLFLRGRLSTHAKEILRALVTEAEEFFGAGQGAQKFSAVLCDLLATMPPVTQLLFTDKTLRAWIEEAVAAMKTSWQKKGENE